MAIHMIDYWDNEVLWDETWQVVPAANMQMPPIADELWYTLYETDSTLIEIGQYPENTVFSLLTYDDTHDLPLSRNVLRHMLVNLLQDRPATDLSSFAHTIFQPDPNQIFINTEIRSNFDMGLYRSFAFLENSRPALFFSAPLSEVGLAWVRRQMNTRLKLLHAVLPDNPPDSGAESGEE